MSPKSVWRGHKQRHYADSSSTSTTGVATVTAKLIFITPAPTPLFFVAYTHVVFCVTGSPLQVNVQSAVKGRQGGTRLTAAPKQLRSTFPYNTRRSFNVVAMVRGGTARRYGDYDPGFLPFPNRTLATRCSLTGLQIKIQ